MTGIGEVVAGVASMITKVTETSVAVEEVISETEAALDEAESLGATGVIDGLNQVREQLEELLGQIGSIASAADQVLIVAKSTVEGTTPTHSGGAAALPGRASAQGDGGGIPDMAQRAPAPPPAVVDPKLSNFVANVYKGTANPRRIGDGTTMDAVRNELATGRPSGRLFHTVKAQETISGLENWLRRNPEAASADRDAATALIQELRDALGGQ